MKSRVLRPAHLRRLCASNSSPSAALWARPSRAASSLSQRPNAQHVSFPGAVKSAFTHELKYETPSDLPAMPTYRAVDQDGVIVDESFVPDLTDAEVIKLYKDMVFISVLDLIMFDAQRQGRVSFYMVSAGEEALSVGSASVLAPEDVIFCQYREQGVFKQRGFTTADFMNQLFANVKDPGRGRNMPVHYGSKELNIVSTWEMNDLVTPTNGLTAHHFLTSGNAASPGLWGCICSQDAKGTRPEYSSPRSGGLFRRGCRQ